MAVRKLIILSNFYCPGGKMKSKGLAMMLFWASVIAVVLALLDALSVNVWLAASTWLVVAAVVGIWAIYTDEK